jgi:predicted amidohydrolase YtcJ
MNTRLGFLRNTIVLTGILATVIIGSVSAQEVLKADTIVTNGRIVTMDNKEILSPDPGNIVESMAIRQGKILALGTNQQMQQYAQPSTRYIDVQGKTVIPGIVETHVHPESTVNNIDHLASARDPYAWAPGWHTAVLIEQEGAATLEKIRKLMAEHPPLANEWVHVFLIPNENTSHPDIGTLTNSLYADYITMDDVSRAIPNNPAALGSGTGQSIVRQDGIVVRVTVAPDGKSQSTVLKVADNLPTPKPAFETELLAEGNPFSETIFKQNIAMDIAEADHAHMGCPWAEDGPKHGHHCSHRAAVMNKLAYEATIKEWPGFVLAANEYVSLTYQAGDRGLITETFRDAWDETMFPNRMPRKLYNELLKESLLHYAAAGVTMVASSIEGGDAMTGFYQILREDKRLPIRFGYGYEMFRSPLLYPNGPQLVQMLGAHVGTPHANPWFWPMGITDGGAGDARQVNCFGDDLSGPEDLKNQEMCMQADAYRIERILATALKSGWRPFSMHSFGSNAFRLHTEWIEKARVEAGMSIDDIRDLRIGFAHGGAIGKVPDVIELMLKYNFYIPIQPNDVASSLTQVKRYGPEGLEFLAPTKTLIEAGVKVVGETEYSRMHPGIYFNALDLFAHRRVRNASAPLETAEIVMPEEAVSRATALRLYTSQAAEWLFAEELVGTLEAGKFADFVVLDRDMFTVPTDEFLDNKVIMTIVGDEIVYQDPEFQPAITTAAR